ncbi:MAG: transglycosylase family protein [Acidimicrobiales bacterium]|nr:transglycosylase family protein [Acidimicrobiales bacterium]
MLIVPLALVAVTAALRSPRPIEVEMVAAPVDGAGSSEAEPPTSQRAGRSLFARSRSSDGQGLRSAADEDERTTTSVRVVATSTAPRSSVTASTAPVTTASVRKGEAITATNAVPSTSSTTTTASRPTSQAGAAATPQELAVLACIRQRESGGNYAAVSANGLYHGAYQFLQSTWNGAAQLAGRPDLIGIPPERVAPADQDAVALALYRASGLGPWGGHCP